MADPLVAVAPGTFYRGVDAPGYKERTYDWRARGEANTAAVRPAYEVMPLSRALVAVYTTDAHLVTYVLSRDHVPLTRQPRMNKRGLAWLLLEQGFEIFCDSLFCDVDLPGHGEWTPALRAQLDEQLAELEVLSTCGLYLTQHGYRLIQPLDEPVAPPSVERYLASWLAELEAAGVTPDPHCRDWTRHYRLPHVRRGGRAYRSPLVVLERMQPRAISPKRCPGVCDAGRRLAA